jgi:hypothetical protein
MNSKPPKNERISRDVRSERKQGLILGRCAFDGCWRTKGFKIYRFAFGINHFALLKNYCQRFGARYISH